MLVSASIKLFRSTVILATWGVLSLLGLFFFLLGHSLVQPSTWQIYAPFAYPYLAMMGVASTLFVLRSLRRNHAQAGHCLPERLLAWLSVLRRAADRGEMMLRTQAHVTSLKNLLRALTASSEHKRVMPGGGWMLAVTTFVLLILLFAALAG